MVRDFGPGRSGEIVCGFSKGEQETHRLITVGPVVAVGVRFLTHADVDGTTGAILLSQSVPSAPGPSLRGKVNHLEVLERPTALGHQFREDGLRIVVHQVAGRIRSVEPFTFSGRDQEMVIEKEDVDGPSRFPCRRV